MHSARKDNRKRISIPTVVIVLIASIRQKVPLKFLSFERAAHALTSRLLAVVALSLLVTMVAPAKVAHAFGKATGQFGGSSSTLAGGGAWGGLGGGLDCINGAPIEGVNGPYCSCQPGWVGTTCNEQEPGGGGGGGGGTPPEETVPHEPFPVQLLSKTATSITFEWRDRSSVEERFLLERNESGGNWILIDDQIAPIAGAFGWSDPPYTDQNLAPDTRYCYRMKAYNSEHGESVHYSPQACAYTDRVPRPGISITSLRLLTHNIYGFDDDNGTGGVLPWGFLANHCEQRAQTLGETIADASPAYDIVAIQEYYDTFDFETRTCDSGPFMVGMQSTGRYLYDENQFLFQPSGGDSVWEMNGGLGVFSMHPIVDADAEKWTWYCRDQWTYEEYVSIFGSQAVSEAEFDELECTQEFYHSLLQGVAFARIELSDADLTIDTYVVHTYATGADNCDALCHRRELEQLADFITYHSADSGNPVIVMGDFNIAGPPGEPDAVYDPNDPQFEQYRALTSILGNPRDLWIENHPTRAGYTSDDCWWGLPRGFMDEDHHVPNDRQGPCADHSSRIDYILVLTDPRFTNSPYELVVRNRDEVKVVAWSTGWMNVSDHYGVEATVEVRRPLDVFVPYRPSQPPALYYPPAPASAAPRPPAFTFGSATLQWYTGPR